LAKCLLFLVSKHPLPTIIRTIPYEAIFMLSTLFKAPARSPERTRRPHHTLGVQPHAVQPDSHQTHASSPRSHAQAICECDICLRNLVKYFDEIPVVNDVSFHLHKGELMALLGPSGCGKTTTLRLIAGFERLDGGEIEIRQQIMAGPAVHLPPEKRRIGMVFQEYALFPHLDVAENVRFGLQAYTGDRAGRVAEVLDLVGLAGFEERMPHELSGGQQQRVALARALAPEPHLIVLDEPFSNLDASLRTRVRAEVRAILRAAGATAIFVTHDQEEALSLVDQVAVMIDGTVHQVAPPHELYGRPASRAVAAFVGEANFLPGTARDRLVECELGRLSMVTTHSGAVDVMIRPENIAVEPLAFTNGASTHGTPPAYVRNILFFGHDQLITVELASGRQLDTRIVGPSQHVRIGQPVQLRASGPVMTYQ